VVRIWIICQWGKVFKLDKEKGVAMNIKYENVLTASNFFLSAFTNSFEKLSNFQLIEIILGFVFASKNMLKVLERAKILAPEVLQTIELRMSEAADENVFQSAQINKILEFLKDDLNGEKSKDE
jgi:hypothetical protein